MFGRRKPSRSHTQQLIDELMESYGHLKLAAGHVADGATERVVPSYDRAREVASRGVNTTVGTFSPLYGQIRDGGAPTGRGNKRMSKRRRWPLLVGLVAAGTAAGAIGAMAARRRRTATQWDDYEPLPSIDDLAYGGSGSGQSGHKMASGAASMADNVSNQAGKIAESLHDKAGRGGTGNGRAADSPLG